MLGQQIGLIRPNLSDQAKGEWIRLAFLDLADLPAGLVVEGLQRARKTCRFEGDVVPTVLEYVEPRIDRLKAEQRVVETIMAACQEAKGNGNA